MATSSPRQYDQQDIVAGAKRIIKLMGSTDPECMAQLDALKEQLFKPFEDDLTQVDALLNEGHTADEAWEEVDRLKRHAGIKVR